jgi:hypothetical protein
LQGFGVLIFLDGKQLDGELDIELENFEGHAGWEAGVEVLLAWIRRDLSLDKPPSES